MWSLVTFVQIAAYNSFVEGYPGLEQGFATWIRADGSQCMVVVPANNQTRLEAWRPILEDDPPIQVTSACDAGALTWIVTYDDASNLRLGWCQHDFLLVTYRH